MHHLNNQAKRELFVDLNANLQPGGGLFIADLYQPTRPVGEKLAADQWNERVKEQSRVQGRLDAYRRFREAGWNHFTDPEPFDRPSKLFQQLKWLEAAGFEDVFWASAGHVAYGGWRT